MTCSRSHVSFDIKFKKYSPLRFSLSAGFIWIGWCICKQTILYYRVTFLYPAFKVFLFVRSVFGRQISSRDSQLRAGQVYLGPISDLPKKHVPASKLGSLGLAKLTRNPNRIFIPVDYRARSEYRRKWNSTRISVLRTIIVRLLRAIR